MYFCVCLVIVFSFITVSGQEAETTTATELTPTICQQCACANDTVDCQGLNLIESFDLAQWEELKDLNIKKIDLSGNSIESLTQISMLPIESLNVSNNRIDFIDDWCFKYLENITTLDLSGNMLTDMNKQVFWGLAEFDKIRSFTKIKYLSLANNNLHVVTRDLFTFMTTLTFLDLSKNPLGIIDQVTMGTLSELTLLRELRLSSCSLELLPNGLFRTFRRLDRLDLSNNKFTKVPAALSEPINLSYLNFNKNPITELTEKTAISSLTKLKELQLCSTKLQTIAAGALGELESLEILYLCNNKKLTVIDEDFLTWEDDDDETKMWPPIKEIYIYNNNVTVIDPDILSRWDVVTALNFDDNPYVCDCNAQWMVDVLVPLIVSLNQSAANLMCSRPQDTRGLTFGQLYESSKTLNCDSADLKNLQTPDIPIILGVMIGVFVTFPLVLILVLLWKRGYFARCRKGLRSEPASEEEVSPF